MSISSLQDLIAKFNGNFNLQPGRQAPAADKTAAATDAKTPAEPTSEEAKTKDKVTLSAEALAYQKAHTLASGKFMVPNVFGDFMDELNANDGSDQGSDGTTNSLLDALNGGNASGGDIDPGSISSGDLPKLLSKLKDFLA